MRRFINMKAQILKQLRTKTDFVSGQEISQHLGISRVAVWKHIQKLQSLGYTIESGPKGYSLLRSPDTPFAWEFPQRESDIHYFSQIESTMDIARKLARQGCPALTVATTDIQSKGRGRMDRNWQSPPGGLYFTIVLRPDISPITSPLINFTASLVLVQTMQALFQVEARVKWPNDILVGNKKICGMLSEMEVEADIVSFINIGIGININNDPPPDVSSASSIRKITGRAYSRKNFLAGYLDRLEDRLGKQDLGDVIPEWKVYSATLGQNVKIATRKGATEGLAVDVDDNGALLVRQVDGSIKKIYYGDCFHI